MPDISRRRFIAQASAGAVAAGAAVVGGRSLLTGGGPGSSTATPPTGTSGLTADGPVVAHVLDVSTGTIDLYVGTKKVTVTSPEIASALHQAVL